MITVMLGMNDGWWGTESPEVDAYFKKGYGELLDTLRKAAPDATVRLIRPTPYDEITHGPARRLRNMLVQKRIWKST